MRRPRAEQVIGSGFTPEGPGIWVSTMRNAPENDERMTILAVLAAAAREAEELLADETAVPVASTQEANRRVKMFMEAARQTAR